MTYHLVNKHNKIRGIGLLINILSYFFVLYFATMKYSPWINNLFFVLMGVALLLVVLRFISAFLPIREKVNSLFLNINSMMNRKINTSFLSTKDCLIRLLIYSLLILLFIENNLIYFVYIVAGLIVLVVLSIFINIVYLIKNKE